MLLTLGTTHRPATDLGYVLRKHPGRAQVFDLTFGKAHVFYPEACEERCTVALLVEVDPVALVRGRGSMGEGGMLDQYVNDRPYAASSFLSVAIAEVFGTAMSGKCDERPELAGKPLPLAASVAAMPCRGGEGFLRRLFEPLGYAVAAERLPLDAHFPEWGEGPYHRVELAGEVSVDRLLSHLYVLVPVLDDEKHYWVGEDEVAKLLRRGAGWLDGHPEREVIAERYLKHRRTLVAGAMAQLSEDPGEAGADAEAGVEEDRAERGMSLHEERLGMVLSVLKASGAATVLDLGCGEGRLLRLLIGERQFEKIVGMDVSSRALEVASEKLRMDRMPPMQRARIELIHGSLVYRDARLEGFDAAAVVEVVEHLDPPRLEAFARALFGRARPRTVVLTTPNREYNAKWPALEAGRLRHGDHRFEWTRAEFAAWAGSVAGRFSYAVRIIPVGPEDAALGAPSQMGVFERSGG